MLGGAEDDTVDISADITSTPSPPPAAAAVAVEETPVDKNALDDDYEDLASFEQSDLVEDLASLSVGGGGGGGGGVDNVVKTRTYDMSITYDKYYQTPRVSLCVAREREMKEKTCFPETFF
jgi:ubiquitin-like-conjugating enzyme ATG3